MAVQDNFAMATTIDPETGKPMPKVSAALNTSAVKGPDGNYFIIEGIDCRGRSTSKPLASAYAFHTYWSVDTDPNGDTIEVSNGTAWVVMV